MGRRRKTLIDITNCNAKMCKTCIFHTDQQIVTVPRLNEIMGYLAEGTNHFCHTTDKICRGGRDFQLKVFCAMRLIEEPTDEALYRANEQFLDSQKIMKNHETTGN